VEEMFHYVFNAAAKNKKETESVLEIDRKPSGIKVVPSHENRNLFCSELQTELEQAN
jgi:hypothetical protein